MTFTETRLQRPDTLLEAVVRHLRTELLSGRYAPGEPLREMNLALGLNTSRGTVREALRVLHDQGLVEVFPHRGAFVLQMTPEKAVEVFDLRQLLESHAIAIALRNGPVDDETLRALTAAFSTLCAAADGGDAAAVIEADMEFHRLASAASHQTVLLEHLRILQSQTRQVVVQTKLYHSDLQGEAETHRPILEAIRAGDGELAADAVSRHIGDTIQLLMTKMEQGRTEQGGDHAEERAAS